MTQELIKDELIKKFCKEIDMESENAEIKEITNEKHEVEFIFPHDAIKVEEVQEAIIKTTYTVTERFKFLMEP